jgi:hypothetical protein
MTSVFIVRPFGKKSVTVKDRDGKDTFIEVDFDHIDKSLIQPALLSNNLEGKTTGVIAEAGNIRLDMFQMLIACDLVIADISIDNANVFYELGIRHGLRPKGTILIRFPTSGKDVPFDLKTDRYIAYERENPAAAVDLLTGSISDTLLAMQTPERKADSPVFLLLPALIPPDPAKLTIVPREFQEAVERADKDATNGRTTLALLGEEAIRNLWAREALRLVGRAQRRMKAFRAACESWEYIQRDLLDDIEANLQLATIYQRLGDPVTASQACKRVLENTSAKRKDRADARSQLASNEKAAWVAEFKKVTPLKERRQRAISDIQLISAFEGYWEGFLEDLNNYYSSINAFSLLTVIVRLAEEEADAWASCFEYSTEADNTLVNYRKQLSSLRETVRISLETARLRAKSDGKTDEWLLPSEAQYKLLTVENKLTFVLNAYTAAKTAGGDSFSVHSEAAQVDIFNSLGLFAENCQAALEGLGVTQQYLDTANQLEQSQPRNRVIVVTGHRADAPDRPPPGRFPNTPECIAKAKAWLRQVVEAEKAKAEGTIAGISGAASGTDLLFLEVCDELDIPTKIVLPIPIDDYRQKSVVDGGPVWVEKFNRLITINPPIILSNRSELPAWARTIPNYSVFQRGNIWMIEDALLRTNADASLLALWDGKAGDGPGGTADMVEIAKKRGANFFIKNTNELFGLDANAKTS